MFMALAYISPNLNAAPMLDNEIILSNGNRLRKVNYRPGISRLITPGKDLIYNQYKIENTDINQAYEDYLNMKQSLEQAQEKVTDDMLFENLSENKAYVEYIVQTASPEARKNNINRINISPKRQKILFKADKNLKRVEKKSWKIPMKTIALYTENKET